MSKQDMDQQNKRKNPDNIPPMGGEEPEKKKNRFNIYWIYGIIFLSIIAYNLVRGVNSAGIETDQQSFYAMVKQGDVDTIKTIRNQKLVRVFVNRDSLRQKAAFYRSILNTPSDPKRYDNVLRGKWSAIIF